MLFWILLTLWLSTGCAVQEDRPLWPWKPLEYTSLFAGEGVLCANSTTIKNICDPDSFLTQQQIVELSAHLSSVQNQTKCSECEECLKNGLNFGVAFAQQTFDDKRYKLFEK